ncbi:multidrug efflux pump subunit AcrB [Rhodobium orientis]|uniref:Acriflavin resistance protein n=1 Tax=Rhodobium orientis TaxID=34017 RepID=A0A327JGP9_9HYPH|nr:efflux RND transporter permease subunit [Rhodobium orientis]MBB4304431.1 multidrug efflux pump subunit AcrB [Rhodobium orientis]MBK5949956.1 acriflavin resistance protein [Rhodobium orientis]RAI25580.1 acriflavin resistance protein [Rhodobium orientis]
MADTNDTTTGCSARNGKNGKGEHVHAPGLAGTMARTFIHSPLSPLFLVCCLAAGILGLTFTPRQEDPQISVPMVDIFIQYEGASAAQVTSLAIDPLERMMSEIPGVKHVYSASQRGQGMVTVEFDVGEKMEPSLVKLYDKLFSNLDKIPPGVSEPLVKPKGVDDVPVVALTLWSESLDDAALRLVSLELVQRLKEVPNTSQSFIVGGRAEEMRVEIQPERLSGFGISIDQVAGAITSANEKKRVGYSEIDGTSFNVYSGAFLKHASDLEHIIVGTYNGSPVYLRDVAKVTEGAGEATNSVQYFTGPAWTESGQPSRASVPDGAPAVTIAIAKKPGSNGVTVADAVLDKVEQLKGRIIPGNVEIAVTRNYGETANDKVNELIVKLFVATGAVTLLIWLFLGIRAALVVLIVIPVVILITVFSAWILGYTIDRVSLFALIFSIGILVDDAIVVVENIYRRWLLKGEVDTPTTIDAVREVGNPTILATFTVIAALLPMGFVSGMMGPYMEPIPALGSVAMLFSLIAAFLFTPWLAYRIRPSLARLHKAQESEHRQSEALGRFYRRILTPFIESPAKGRMLRIGIWLVFALSCVLFYTTDVAVKMLPFDNKPEFNVVVNMPDGTALAETANVTQRLVDEVLKIDEVTAVQSYAGTASPFNFNGLVRHYYLRQRPWQADIQVQLLDKGDRARSSHQIAAETRNILTPIAEKLGARIAIVEMPPGPPVLQTLVAEVYGQTEEIRVKVAKDLTRIFEEAPSVVDVDNYLDDPHERWLFEIDRQKALREGVSIKDINRQLGMALGGYKLGDAKLGHELEPRYIVLQAPLNVRSQISALGELPIRTAGGAFVPLSELGRFTAVPQDKTVYHKDLRPLEYVTGDVAGRLGAPIYGMFAVGDLLADYTPPDGGTLAAAWVGPPTDGFRSAFEWTGEWTVTYETFRDMGIAFGAAMVLIYMLVVWEFGNFRLPGIIMAPIPLTLIGIVPGHWLLGAEFTATSMIGFIALAGIIVRNSILLVDFSRQAVENDVPVTDAVVQACRTRTRPIMITALALVAGSSVIITDPIFQGMAISLMFGGMVSTLLTLVVIPLACVRTRQAIVQSVEYSSGNGFGEAAASAAAVPLNAEEAAENARANAGPGAAEPERRGFFARIAESNAVQTAKLSVTMAFYALRAMPYFAWLAIKEAGKGLFARKEKPASPFTPANPAPAPAAATPAPQAPAPAAAAPAPTVVASAAPAPQPVAQPYVAPAPQATAPAAPQQSVSEPAVPPMQTPAADPPVATGPQSAETTTGPAVAETETVVADPVPARPAAAAKRPARRAVSKRTTARTAAKAGAKPKKTTARTPKKPAAKKADAKSTAREDEDVS